MARPRTTCLEDNELELLGNEMLEWVKQNPQTLHLSEWYTIEKMFTYNEWKQFIAKPIFHPYYEAALKIIGRQYLDKTSNVREGVSQRWQRVYFKDLREEEDATKEFDAKLKAQEHTQATQEQQQGYERFINQLADIRERLASKNKPQE